MASRVPPLLSGLLCQCRVSYLPGNMADTKGGNLSRLVLKQAGRAKEKVNSRDVEDQPTLENIALLGIILSDV